MAQKNTTKAKREYSHRKHARRSRLLLSVLVLLLGLIALTITFVVREHRRNSQKEKQATEAIREVINGSAAQVTLTKVESTYGFVVNYDKSTVSLTAMQADGKELPEDGLGKGGYLRIVASNRSKEGVPSEGSGNLEILTSKDKNFTEVNRKRFGKDLSEQAVADAYFESVITEKSTLELTGDITEQHGVASYHKRSFVATDKDGLKTVRQLVLYVTVQNGRPYAAILRAPTVSNTTQAGFAQIIDTLQFVPPDTAILGLLPKGKVSLAAAEAPSGFVNAPVSLRGDSALKIVAKHQPAVVRIGSIACADIEIIADNGVRLPKVSNACGAGAGSGSIVSKDGIISTNGHVVKLDNAAIYQTYLMITYASRQQEPTVQYLKFLINAKLLSDAEARLIATRLDNGDVSAFDEILATVNEFSAENLVGTNRTESFVVQLSDEPMKPKIEGSKLSFYFTDKNVEAKFIAMDFDDKHHKGSRQNISESTGSDVAILKIDGKEFPVNTLGSIEELSPRSELTAIGFPGFVDGGVITKKDRTIPSATQGNVTDIVIDSDKSNRKLVVANLPIAQGNSGGPAFDEDGKAVGLTTYSGDVDDPEAGVSKFSKVGILRDIADFKLLLSKNSMQLDTNSDISSKWEDGIDKFSIAHYKDAVKKFDEVKNAYPQNYLATQFIELANTKIANGEDLSGNKAIKNLLMLLAVFAVMLTLVILALIRHAKRGQAMMAQLHQPLAAGHSAMPAYIPMQVQPPQPVPQVPSGQPAYQPTAPAPVVPPQMPIAPQPVAAPPSPSMPQVAPVPSPVASPAPTLTPQIPQGSVQPVIDQQPVPQPVQAVAPVAPQPSPVQPSATQRPGETFGPTTPTSP